MPVGGVDDSFGFGCVVREWLLNDDVDAGLEAIDRHLGVLVMGGADVDHVGP